MVESRVHEDAVVLVVDVELSQIELRGLDDLLTGGVGLLARRALHSWC